MIIDNLATIVKSNLSYHQILISSNFWSCFLVGIYYTFSNGQQSIRALSLLYSQLIEPPWENQLGRLTEINSRKFHGSTNVGLK